MSGSKQLTSACSRDATIRAGFVKIFVWNVAFAVISVRRRSCSGMLLALLLQRPAAEGQGVLPLLLILPYALPGFVTALVWTSMFNQDFGLINKIPGLDIDWLGNAWAAKAAILIGQPVAGLPLHVHRLHRRPAVDPRRRARGGHIDGAGALRMLRSIIMPLLLVAVGPLLIASLRVQLQQLHA